MGENSLKYNSEIHYGIGIIRTKGLFKPFSFSKILIPPCLLGRYTTFDAAEKDIIKYLSIKPEFKDNRNGKRVVDYKTRGRKSGKMQGSKILNKLKTEFFNNG